MGLCQKIEEINLKGNQLTDLGACHIEKALPFNNSLISINLQKNIVSDQKVREINQILRRGSPFDTVSIYLLGYGDTGKTSLRATLNNARTWSAWFGFNVIAESVFNTEVTRGLEVDKRVSIGQYNVQIIDFGGQHHYHHSTHHFTRASRALFIVLANPFETGYQEQLWYWLRLLNVKSTLESKPEVLVVFSRRDEARQKGDLEAQKLQELEELMEEVEISFEDTLNVTKWVWMDCTRTRNAELYAFLKSLRDSVNLVMNRFRMVVPDPNIPQRILQSCQEIFYEQRQLDQEISRLIHGDEETARNWTLTLLKSHDFFAIPVEGNRTFICADLQRFGREILSLLVEMKDAEGSHHVYSIEQLKAKFQSLDPGNKWINDLPKILCALQLAFLLPPNRISIPCAISTHTKNRVISLWHSHPSPLSSCQGRRLTILDEKRQMYHPAFLPQTICKVLSFFQFDEEPIIWQGGLVCKGKNGCLLGLYMHGAFIPAKMEERLKNRRHGEPERLQTLDLLTKGEGSEEVLKRILEALKELVEDFWSSLEWKQAILLPSTVQRYFSIRGKKEVAILPLPLAEDSKGRSPIAETSTWKEVEELLLQREEWPGFTPFHLACHEGDLTLLRRLVEEEPGINVNEPTPAGMTPLVMACQNNQIQVVKYLIANGKEVDLKKGWRSKKPLEIVKDEGHLEVLKILEDYKQDPLEMRTRFRKEFQMPLQPCIEMLVIYEERHIKKEIQVNPPFSLRELGLSLANSVNLSGSFRQEYWNDKYSEYLTLENLEQLNREPRKIKIVPDQPWVHPYYKRWIPRENHRYLSVIEEGKVMDKELAETLDSFMAHFAPKDSPVKINKAVAIDNSTLRANFEGFIETLHGNINASRELFRKETWKEIRFWTILGSSRSMKDYEHRLMFWTYFQDYLNKFEWNEALKLPIAPMIQGTNEKGAENIVNNGFAAVATLDDGFYGTGIYFTKDLTYAQQYSRPSPQGKVYVIAMVVPGNVYPVTEEPSKYKPSFLGKPCQKGYQSHFTIVTKGGKESGYPLAPDILFDEKKHADELVVFQNSQALPLFLVYI